MRIDNIISVCCNGRILKREDNSLRDKNFKHR